MFYLALKLCRETGITNKKYTKKYAISSVFDIDIHTLTFDSSGRKVMEQNHTAKA